MTEVEYLPYKTINVFIEQEFLEELVEQVLNNLKILPKDIQIEFNKLFKRYVTVLGFRNSLHAPQPLQIKAYAKAFEEKDEVIPLSLSIWAKINDQLANDVLDWLKNEKWENLATNRKFDESQGFMNNWPEDHTIEALIEKFLDTHPGLEISKDDLNLMILWISGRLPI